MHLAVWVISLVSIFLVVTRPKGISEAWWAAAGALLLVVTRLLDVPSAVRAVGKGLDVYLFLIGMMIISELARREGVFDWIADHAVRASRGSRRRLFVLVYGVGMLVTVFLSNDATAVVLTPAVLTVVKVAEADALPYLLTCAFIANAASFVLPISNPANLVVFGKSIPSLGKWLMAFGLPSVGSIVVTFLVLRWLARKRLIGDLKTDSPVRRLSGGGVLALGGIGVLAAVLMTASAFDADLGAPACVCGLLVAIVIGLRDGRVISDIAGKVSWSVVPLVAGLFIIVEALNQAGALKAAIEALGDLSRSGGPVANLSVAFGVALLSNLMNNLPSGLIAGSALQGAGSSHLIRIAVLVGVDLGPNLSVSGSLATILWLIAIRREGQEVRFLTFLKWGIAVMPPALAVAVLLIRP